jgi:hypothetical protein
MPIFLVTVGGAEGGMHRFLVKIKPANIFKGVLESWNSTQNAGNSTQMRAKSASIAHVYHAVINHAAPPTALYLALRPAVLP